jgi:hypothetical protein
VLRVNVSDRSSEALWWTCTQPAEAEAAFRVHKSVCRSDRVRAALLDRLRLRLPERLRMPFNRH